MEKANQDQLNLHIAKTYYFNTLWKEGLLRLGFVVLMYLLYLLITGTTTSTPSYYIILSFDLSSIVILLTSMIFLSRLPGYEMISFQSAFLFSLVQSIWYIHDRMANHFIEQFPFGAFYFVLAWSSDRYMLSNLSMAEKAASTLKKNK